MHRIDEPYRSRPTCRTLRGLYVNLCVGHTGKPFKTAKPIEMLVYSLGAFLRIVHVRCILG